MHTRLRSLALLATLAFSLPALAKGDEAPAKPAKNVFNNVRYSRDDKALAELATDAQGKFLLGDDWAKGTDAQRKEFTQLFNSLFSKIAFPKVRENLKNIGSNTYEDATVEGDKAKVKSLVVIDHPLKKQEMKLTYTTVKEGGGWKVMDVSVLGDSMLTGIRDDQVRPIFTKGGWDGLLAAMRKKNDEVSKK